ncbi:MAG: 2-oxoacid:acceptor oxidoreductase family protein [Deltaproteobacteria bacterium]|nr:MAG: 2-oxoacid:acceptor oxidoreductase family protein [Deltaproteobacteria bacterium]
MDSLLNKDRPPVFCPGCSHKRITTALDKAFRNMGLKGNEVGIVSDIGCSGLFDTFFHTHALHGLHGRALTYAAGIKLARPELKVVVTMGDGGQGIGGAHLLAACRRNLDLTLLILNNFNFGMTGGQFSATTPPDAQVGSRFLNQLERPLDVCQVARSAGAPYVTRCSSYRKDLAAIIEQAIRFEGFSIIDMWGICPGRYTRSNKLTPKMIEASLGQLPPLEGVVAENARPEYGRRYRELAARQHPAAEPVKIEKKFDPPQIGRREVTLLGSAGQRILTAGEILCLAGLSAGLKATQKNDYNITVLRGPSISELVLSTEEIGFTGIDKPDVIIALSQEGIDRRKSLFGSIDQDTLIIQIPGVTLPPSQATIHTVNFKSSGIRSSDWATAALVILAKSNTVLTLQMLNAALEARFSDKSLSAAKDLVEKVKDSL